MARGRRRNRRRTARGDKFSGIVLGFIGVLLLGMMAFGWWWIESHRQEYDEATNCPKAGPRAIHAILIDRSDPITPQQGQLVKQYMNRLVLSAQFAERFDIYTIEGNTSDSLLPVLTVCSPGRGSKANKLYENPKQIEERFRAKFIAVMDRVTSELLVESTRPSSPILESIKAAAITSFGPYEAGTLDRRISIVSDMIQHSELNSHFRGQIDFDQLSAGD
jgi:hypothetical protein